RWLKDRRIFGVADPSIWDASRGDAIIEAADRNLVHFYPGDNKRIPGWMQCHYRLSFGEDGYPMVYFFNTCRDAIRTLPLLTYSDTCPEDLDTDGEDHFADSFRYFCMCRPIRPRSAPSQADHGDDPLDLLADKTIYDYFSY
ncbi:MAG: Terminase-like family protein, partial [Clostridia bacterium]|nr:Terminase-like family protein [Clostridia bacterium]